MTEIGGIIYLAVLVVFLVYQVIRIRKQKKGTAAVADGAFEAIPSLKDRANMLKELLVSMQCPGEWADIEGGDMTEVRFEYQTGNFIARVVDNSPYVTLIYPFFFETSPTDLELVREACNRCNQNTETAILMYSVTGEGTVNVHIVTNFMILTEYREALLKRSISEVFNWQNGFLRYFNENKGMAYSSDRRDAEKSDAMNAKMAVMSREMEMMEQTETQQWHISKQSAAPLKQLLTTVLPIEDLVPVKLTIMRNGEVLTVDDADRIAELDFMNLLIDGERFAAAEAQMVLDYYDARRPAALRHIMIDLREDHSADDTLYCRATLTAIPLSADADVPMEINERQRAVTSVLIGRDITPRAYKMEEFRYRWKEAQAKMDAGNQSELTKDEQMMVAVGGPHTSWMVYKGQDLYVQKRYYEALLYLLGAWQDVSAGTKGSMDNNDDVLMYVSYLIGCCYMALHQWDKAHFYLEITLRAQKVEYTKAFINSLVLGNDFRAVEVIDRYIQDLTADEEDGDGGTDDMQPFINFLYRRKVSALMKRSRLKAAESLLRQMEDSPENAEFVKREMENIRRLREKE